MTTAQARDRLEHGQWEINDKRTRWDRRQNYLDGLQDLPYAPDGVNDEYMELRYQAIANWLAIAMGAPLQRLKANGFRKGDGAADKAVWEEIWQPNMLDSRQSTVYMDMLVHERGLMSVWPNQARKSRPQILPESGRHVHLQPRDDNPWVNEWAVKRVDLSQPHRAAAASRLWVPKLADRPAERLEFGFVYDDDSWVKFQREQRTAAMETTFTEWEQVDGGSHPLQALPFVTFDNRPTTGGQPRSDIDQLMPAQDALNTIRFQTLLALQFSAYRQRIVSGFDPVARDASGNPIYRINPETDEPLLDHNGMPIPILVSPGRPGVDRLLVFPGDATKIFDLPESNLDNYITVLGEFLVQLFAVGQVPPQYLLSRMANLSGDALTAAESTLTSKVKGLQVHVGESLEQVMRLALRATGNTAEDDFATEVIWAEAEVRTFAQVVDAIVKLISSGMAVQDAWTFLPDATPPRLEQWKKNADARAREALALTTGAKGAMPTPGGSRNPLENTTLDTVDRDPARLRERNPNGSDDLG